MMEYREIPVSEIEASPFQVREEFEEESMEELASSIEKQGDIQPVIVREKNGDGYQLICGERRWRASKIADEDRIPALVRDTDPENILLESLVENIHREDLTSQERENAVYELWESGEWDTKKELAEELGKSPRWVESNTIAAMERREMSIPKEVSTRDIRDVAGLEKEEREKVLRKKAEGEIAEKDLREFKKAVQEADEETKEILLEEGKDIEDVDKAKEISKNLSKLDEETREKYADKDLDEIDTETLKLEVRSQESEKSKKKEIPKEMEDEVGDKADEIEKNVEKRRQKEREVEQNEEIQKKKELRENWENLTGIQVRANRVNCPLCEVEDEEAELVFDCSHGLTVDEAKAKAKKKFEEAQGD